MPKLYEYMGIVIMFYSNEHEPIHVHAMYGKTSVKVTFHIKNGTITRVTYTKLEGNFPENKLRALKKLVGIHKYNMVEMWVNYFVYHVAPTFRKINIKL